MVNSDRTTEQVEGRTKTTALIVDDEKDICFLLQSLLRQKNISSRLAGSLEEANKLLEIQTPAIIFLDNHLPDGMGVENIRRLKVQYPEVRIALITAYDSVADRQKALHEGVDFFIGKPFNKEMIFRVLDDLPNDISVE